MNNKPDMNDPIRDDFDAWLQADEIPAQPPVSFRERLHQQMASAKAHKTIVDQMPKRPNPGGILSFRFYASIAAAVAAVIILFIGLPLINNETPAVESVWLAVEVELYAAMLESIDSEILTELSDLLAFY